eukprot:CAMPEP_0182928394 /NCGR_PEP_ID=MMETSP0105_2-20130417/15565_1 /TAXON_ID=81532 ORGANISM="Acanthoeca-like sp., Strain 10tr" /NCGR_SAMPLE_ID=MMETSP0105_2 /ASSEMBLY_ACC=CAM_ASM_000205 /LENGTH=418 /DNA_ID=CAMNT_0025066397 /DNA_START=31 /DNA_END=1287 /DNA_ORIENTATION=-
MAAAPAESTEHDGPVIPFNDEESFKAWMNAGNKNSKKAVAVNDWADPTPEELELMKSVRALLSKRNQDVDEVTLNRFIRGYGQLHFKGAEDRIERTAIITNLALDWKREVDFASLPDKKFPREAEWDATWPCCVSGLTSNKRVTWFATAPGDLKKFSPAEVGFFHAQDMAELTRTKHEVADREGRKWTGMHHMVILDAGWDGGPGIDRSVLKYLKNSIIHAATGANTTQHYQPDGLSQAFVVNASFLYRALFSFAKLFMETTTANKFHMYGGEFMPALQEAGIPATAIPLYLGGKAPNPPGLRQKLKVPAGKKVERTIVVDSFRKSDAFVWSARLTKGQCNIAITIGDQSEDGKGELTMALTPLTEQTITLVFDNSRGGHSAQVEFIATVSAKRDEVPAPWEAGAGGDGAAGAGAAAD